MIARYSTSSTLDSSVAGQKFVLNERRRNIPRLGGGGEIGRHGFDRFGCFDLRLSRHLGIERNLGAGTESKFLLDCGRQEIIDQLSRGLRVRTTFDNAERVGDEEGTEF